MNNEINKRHEEILAECHLMYGLSPEGNLIWKSAALKAMAEVAGLRDKEVGRLQNKLDTVSDDYSSAMQRLSIAWDRINDKDAEIAELRKYWEEMYVEKANDVSELLKEIEQLKAMMAEMSAFVNPLKEGWK